MLTSCCPRQSPVMINVIWETQQHTSHINSGRDVVPEILPTPFSSESWVSVPSENTSPSSVTVKDTLVETPPGPVLHRYPTRVRNPPHDVGAE